MQVEQVERQIQADRGALIVAAALGAEVEIPSVADGVAGFIDSLFKAV